jgi:hypothetical protein
MKNLLLALLQRKVGEDCSSMFQIVLSKNCQSFKNYFGVYQDSSETISKMIGAIKMKCHNFKLILDGHLLISVRTHDTAPCG